MWDSCRASETRATIDDFPTSPLKAHAPGVQMFGDIARFLIDIIFSLFGAVLLLRVWMQAVRLPPYNPVSHGVFQASDWIVLPLRRIIPGVGGIDWASILAAWLTALVYLVLLTMAADGDPLALFPLGLLMAVLVLVKWALNLLMWMTLLLAILSWINPRTPVLPVLYHLTAPFLNPLRRVLPRLGGMDLSPLILYVLIQVLLIVIARAGLSLFGI
jgi:YggT family protein